MIEKINYIYQSLDRIKFPPFMIGGKEQDIGYCSVVCFGDGYLILDNDSAGRFTCFYRLVDSADDIGSIISDWQIKKATGVFVHKQFLSDDFSQDQMQFILQDGGYKCNLGNIEIYTAGCVAGISQYRDDLIF